MHIQTIGSLHLVLYINNAELRTRGLSASELGLREVLRLTREACRKAGVSLGRMAEIEAYPEGEGALIFVRLDREAMEWFRFDGLPQALDGLLALREEPEGALVWSGAHYCVSARGEGERLTLAEFGTALDAREARMLDESASLILGSEGLKKFWRKMRGSA